MRSIFLTFCAILCLAAIAEAGIDKCIFLMNPRKNGTKVQFHLLVRSRVLPDLYNRKGDCRRVVHADSVKLNGVCTNFDCHKDDFNLMVECKELSRQGRVKFDRCFWNKDNVTPMGIVGVKNAISGAKVWVQLFDKKNCVDRIEKGTITIR